MLRRIVPLVAFLVGIVMPAHAQRGGGSPQSPTAAQAPSPSPSATPARPETPPGEPQAPQAEPGGPGGARLEVAATEDRVSQTSHVIRLDGREIRYTATAGTLPIRLDDGRVVVVCSSSDTRRTART